MTKMHEFSEGRSSFIEAGSDLQEKYAISYSRGKN